MRMFRIVLVQTCRRGAEHSFAVHIIMSSCNLISPASWMHQGTTWCRLADACQCFRTSAVSVFLMSGLYHLLVAWMCRPHCVICICHALSTVSDLPSGQLLARAFLVQAESLQRLLRPLSMKDIQLNLHEADGGQTSERLLVCCRIWHLQQPIMLACYWNQPLAITCSCPCTDLCNSSPVGPQTQHRTLQILRRSCCPSLHSVSITFFLSRAMHTLLIAEHLASVQFHRTPSCSFWLCMQRGCRSRSASTNSLQMLCLN